MIKRMGPEREKGKKEHKQHQTYWSLRGCLLVHTIYHKGREEQQDENMEEEEKVKNGERKSYDQIVMKRKAKVMNIKMKHDNPVYWYWLVEEWKNAEGTEVEGEEEEKMNAAG